MPTTSLPATKPLQFGGVEYPHHAGVLTLFVAHGPRLGYFRVDSADLSLSEISGLALPAPVQYVVAHPTRNLLYVATSNRSVSKADDLHTLATVAVDEHTGALHLLAQVPLPTRPIHLAVSAAGDAILVVYNLPALVTAHAVDENGLAGPVMTQASPVRTGVFPHQVRWLPSGESAVIVARGNHANAERGEQPGGLEFVSLHDGALSHVATVAPNGGHGFGPRHLDFDPTGRWAAVSMERQNALQVFEVLADRFADAPTCTVSTLESDNRSGIDQLCSAVHFNARGDRLYIANRHDPDVYAHGAGKPALLEGNNIAVFGFDAATGRCWPMQQVPTESVHVRTFSLDASGRLLVAASILPAPVQHGDRIERVPARLSFFRVDGDGRLTLAKLIDMPDDGLQQFWTQLVGNL